MRLAVLYPERVASEIGASPRAALRALGAAKVCGTGRELQLTQYAAEGGAARVAAIYALSRCTPGSKWADDFLALLSAGSADDAREAYRCLLAAPVGGARLQDVLLAKVEASDSLGAWDTLLAETADSMDLATRQILVEKFGLPAQDPLYAEACGRALLARSQEDLTRMLVAKSMRDSVTSRTLLGNWAYANLDVLDAAIHDAVQESLAALPPEEVPQHCLDILEDTLPRTTRSAALLASLLELGRSRTAGEEIRCRAINVLRRLCHGESAPVTTELQVGVVGLLQDPSEEIRKCAIAVLGEFRDLTESSRREISRLLADEREQLRMAALHALCDIGELSATELARAGAMLRGSRGAEQWRIAAWLVGAGVREQLAIDTVDQALREGDDVWREVALGSIARGGVLVKEWRRSVEGQRPLPGSRVWIVWEQAKCVAEDLRGQACDELLAFLEATQRAAPARIGERRQEAAMLVSRSCGSVGVTRERVMKLLACERSAAVRRALKLMV